MKNLIKGFDLNKHALSFNALPDGFDALSIPEKVAEVKRALRAPGQPIKNSMLYSAATWRDAAVDAKDKASFESGERREHFLESAEIYTRMCALCLWAADMEESNYQSR